MQYYYFIPNTLPAPPPYGFLLPPLSGAALVRGRAGGDGAPFNLGEMTLTRCAVRLDEAPEITGVGHVAGRNPRHAELVAVFDALLQRPGPDDALHRTVIEPLAAEQAAAAEAESRTIASSRVNFFTMVRGTD